MKQVQPHLEYRNEHTLSKHTVRLSLNVWLFVLLVLYLGISPVYDFARGYLDIPQLGINLILFIGLVVWLVLKAFSGVSINLSRTYYLILFLVGIVSIYQIAAYPRVMEYGDLSFLNYFTTISFSIFFLLIGANIVKLYQVWNKPPWRKFCYVVYCFVLFAVVLAIINNGVSYSNIIGKLIILPSGSDKSFNYLRFADYFAMFTIMLIAWEKRPFIRNCLIVCGLIGLFAINSRTTFFLFALVMVIFIFNRLNKILKAAVITVILLLLTVGNVSDVQYYTQGIASKYEGTPVHRMFRVTDLEMDSSYIARQRLLQEGWAELRQDWLFGKGYMGEAETLGKGSYIHNWLSFWYAYGFIPFVLFCGLSFKLILSTYTLWKRRKNNPVINFVFMYSVLAFLSIILARSYVYTNIWFCLAAMAAVSHNYKHSCKDV